MDTLESLRLRVGQLYVARGGLQTLEAFLADDRRIKEWANENTENKFRNTQQLIIAAKTYMIAKTEGLDAAMLFKLQNVD